jgi:membrane protease YdiL (CAAX protease family)
MGRAAVAVAAVAAPVGAACWYATRRGTPVVPPYRKWVTHWHGLDLFVLAVACIVLREVVADALRPTGVFTFLNHDDDPTEAGKLEQAYQRSTVVGLALIPVFAAGFHVWRRAARAERAPSGRFVADVAAGVLVWVVVTPVVFAVHFASLVVMDALKIPPDQHPLKGFRLRHTLDVAILFLGACVVAPFFEELLYRRMMIPWAVRRWERAWILLAVAMLVAVGSGKWGPPVLVLVMAGVVLAHGRFAPRSRRFPLRPTSALLASATLFGVMHAAVWPSPIPLVVLAVGLGWVVLRTKSLTPAVVAHGLFNAVSAVHLLRGGP